MIIFAGDNTDDEFKLHPLHEGFNYDRTVMTAYDRCSRMDLMGNFMKLVGGKPETVLIYYINFLYFKLNYMRNRRCLPF